MWKFLKNAFGDPMEGMTAKQRVLFVLESKSVVSLPELLAVDPAEYRSGITQLRKEGYVIKNRMTHSKRNGKRVVESEYELVSSPPGKQPSLSQ